MKLKIDKVLAVCINQSFSDCEEKKSLMSICSEKAWVKPEGAEEKQFKDIKYVIAVHHRKIVGIFKYNGYETFKNDSSKIILTKLGDNEITSCDFVQLKGETFFKPFGRGTKDHRYIVNFDELGREDNIVRNNRKKK